MSTAALTECEVLVVGSGGAGLTAALAAARAGADVVVLEANERWGGATGVSGGAVWVPVNHHMAAEGIKDSLATALEYCYDQAPGRDPELVASLLRAGPAMIRFIEENTPIEFAIMDYPDSFAESPGGISRGRHLEVIPLDLGEMAESEDFVWLAPFPMVLTNDELFGGAIHGGTTVPVSLIGRRIASDEVALGLGLVLGLISGCQDAGVRMVNNCRVTSVQQSWDGAVTGVAADKEGDFIELAARRGVILAAGGYEHDLDLISRSVGGPWGYPLCPPVGLGDGLRLAAKAGAEMAFVGECWSAPATPMDGRVWDDPPVTPRPLIMLAERFMPHTLWVNEHAVRFVNEACHNVSLALGEFEPGTHQPRNLPAWSICDAQYREAYAFAGLMPGGKVPDRIKMADTIAGLADAIGVDAATLTGTVDRFNDMARAGRDTDFGRGDSAYDRYNGDVKAPHPTLGTVERPPFFAVQVHRGGIGTKGGPRIDPRGRVLDWSSTPIPNLFAAGNNAASVFGPGAIANGMHLGTGMAIAWMAGLTAAGGKPEQAPGWLDTP